MIYHKICKCCGKPFDTNNPQKLYCNRNHYLPCPVCGKPVLKKDKDFTRPPKCCSTKCSHILRSSKFKPKKCIICGDWFIPTSGSSKICNKVHYKICEICGKSFEVDKSNYTTKTTCSESCTKEKVRRNNLKIYGTEHPMQNLDVQNRYKQSMLSKYGVEYPLQNFNILKKQQSTTHHIDSQHDNDLENNSLQYSKLQKNRIQVTALNLADKLSDLGFTVSLDKNILGTDFNLCIESRKIVIEINPTYKQYNQNDYEVKYHCSRKTKIAESEGYRCIHVFDWDEYSKLLQILTPTRPLYARKCNIYKLYPKYGDDFLKRYHIQGTCRGQLLYTGLEYNGKLVQVMTFGRSRYSKCHDIELLRLCTLPRLTVIGGASKLFHWVIHTYELNNIISYCDCAKFTGDVYEKIGMKFLRHTPPAKVWSKENKKITDNLLRKHGYDQLFKTSYGNQLSNQELMLKNGWIPVYDCGQNVYEYKE